MNFSAALLGCLLTLALLPTGSCNHRGVIQAIEPTPGPDRTLQSGSWGGSHVALDVAGSGVAVEFDCAHGSIDGPVPLDDAGAFSVDGLYFQEHGGPVNSQIEPFPVKARYAGQVNGSQMSLTVLDLDDQQKIGAYLLVLGAAAHITKCL
jgi:hypothetical protein